MAVRFGYTAIRLGILCFADSPAMGPRAHRFKA